VREGPGSARTGAMTYESSFDPEEEWA
jgi:hypothetical protein